MDYTRKVLKNGLRLVLVPMKDNPTVTFMVFVNAGLEYETKKHNGISHFLEHMCFKATKTKSQREMSYELDKIGASNNAYTGHTETSYYAKASFRHAEKILDIVSDIYLNPVFPEAEIKKEKGVVIEEINMYHDSPQKHVWQVLSSLLYGDQSAGWDIAGTKKTVSALKRKDLVDYHKKHYVPEATTVVVAGNFNKNTILKEVERRFGTIKKTKSPSKQKITFHQNKPRIKIEYRKGDQTHFVLSMKSINSDDKRKYALSVLSAILSGGMSSRLYQKMREELGVCYYVSTYRHLYPDRGEFGVYAGVNNARLEEALLAIQAELKKMSTELVSEKELKKAKDYITGHFYMGLESSDAYADYYGSYEVNRQKILKPKERAKLIRKVSAKDIKNLAKLIFKTNHLNLALVGPTKNKDKILKVLHF